MPILATRPLRFRHAVAGVVLAALATACVDGSREPSASGDAARSSGGNSNRAATAASGGRAGETSTIDAGGAAQGSASAGGTTAVGDTAAIGGSGAVAGAGAGMRDIPSTQIVKEMKLGWNLGNTLDSQTTETSWGNPKTTQAMIDTVKAGGFNTVRIPTTWQWHMGGAPDYAVDATFMNRVEEVTNYVLSNGMYAILNTHHDSWVSLMPTADQAAISSRIAKLWAQIANRFKNYDDHLIFETLNEPRTTDATQWTGGTAAARTILNAYNLAAVNAIRATGGNNALRHIMIPTHAANASTTCINALVIPNDDPRIIVSLHTYFPNNISMGGATTWGTSAEKTAMETELQRIYNLLPAKGRAVVIGEWGTINQDNLAVRVDHAQTYAAFVTARGMCPIWWDNGATASGSDGFGLLDRKVSPPTWAFPTVVSALATGATEGAALSP